MGLLKKAKLAMKRVASKGRIRDIALEGTKPLERKSIANQNSSCPSPQGGVKPHTRPRCTILPRPLSPRPPGERRVRAKVVGPQAAINAHKEWKALRIANRTTRSWATMLNAGEYSSIEQLRDLLGLPSLYTSQDVSTTPASPQDALIVSVDTENEKHGNDNHVVEIGVTILDTRDIVDSAPGPSARDWIAKTKTYHYVVDVTRHATERMRTCYFGDDMFADASSIKRHLLGVLQNSANPPFEQHGGHGRRKVVLVGHSVKGDLDQLVRSMELDLCSKETFLTTPTMVFDTFMLSHDAIQQGAEVTSSRLGKLVCWLGIPEQYQQDGLCIGWHNAGNDAAYTMMALLIYAVHYERIITGKAVPISPEDFAEWRRLFGASEWKETFKQRWITA